MSKKTYTIDATGKAIGRIASEAAKMLRGKAEVSFERHIMPEVEVTILNASKVKVLAKKLKEKTYDWYSGYPGGRKEETMAKLVTRKGFAEVITRAVKGMLPNNKLKNNIMKQLIVKE